MSIGVVLGEYGMVEVYDKKCSEVFDWFQDFDECVCIFVVKYVNEFQVMSESECCCVDEFIVVWKFEYGEEQEFFLGFRLLFLLEFERRFLIGCLGGCFIFDSGYCCVGVW